MSHTREPDLPSVGSDAILKKQVTTIHADLDTVTKEGDDAVSG
jgi:hypothetical protein